MSYRASRGGHAPGHLRDALITFIEEEQALPEVDVLSLYGQLWNCTDTAPVDICDKLDLPQGSTFAQVVRYLRSTCGPESIV